MKLVQKFLLKSSLPAEYFKNQRGTDVYIQKHKRNIFESILWITSYTFHWHNNENDTEMDWTKLTSRGFKKKKNSEDLMVISRNIQKILVQFYKTVKRNKSHLMAKSFEVKLLRFLYQVKVSKPRIEHDTMRIKLQLLYHLRFKRRCPS